MHILKFKIITALLVLLTGVSLWYIVANSKRQNFNENKNFRQSGLMAQNPLSTPTPRLPKIYIKQPGVASLLSLPIQTFQTFNNCGAATLSMMLAYFGVSVSQQELGMRLRPFQNSEGINDDKSVTVEELAEESKNYNVIPYYRPNGNIEKLKLLSANGLPILTRTWLKEGEDIGHYRVVKGFDETTREIIQNDSLQGESLRFGYDEFLKLWQGFNYEYLVLARADKKNIVEAILGTESDEKTAWKNALKRAQKESSETPQNPFLVFNQSVAYNKLGMYKNATDTFEKVENRLPPRMLWYQIDPIIAYQKQGDYERVLRMTDQILNNQNLAFSELYILRGESYKSLGQIDFARLEFEKAVRYNKNLKAAQKALEQI